MANKYRVLRNIHSTANHRVVNTAGNRIAWGIEKTAKWAATAHIGTVQRCDIMATCQDIAFDIAKMRLMNRRTIRNNDTLLAFIAGWVIDYVWYLFDLLWGFIGPILYLLITTVLVVLAVGGAFALLFMVVFIL